MYAFPSDADFPLRIVAGAGEVQVLSHNGVPAGDTPVSGHTLVPSPFVATHNKWQNGFVGRDGAVYAIPCNAPAVLRIAPSTASNSSGSSGGGGGSDPGTGQERESNVTVQLVGAVAVGGVAADTENHPNSEGDKKHAGWSHDKWEGGVVGLDGALYCMPQNSKFVLRVDGLPTSAAQDTHP